MIRTIVSFVLFVFLAITASAQQAIQIEVDATEAPRRIFHSTITFPEARGAFVLHYPKWFPGTHAPTGKIVDMVGLRMSAAGKEISWKRDPYDMFTFHCVVPESGAPLEVRFDFVVPTNTQTRHHPSASSNFAAMINWASLVLYPKGSDIKTLVYAPTLKLPQGWKYGTALHTASQVENRVEFSQTALYTLVDSPVIAGAHFKTLDLSPGSKIPYRLHLAADSPAALEMKPEVQAAFQKLIQETNTLFGGKHHEQYHFLLTLSDPLAGGAVEHHESSENRGPERMFLDDDPYRSWADVLPHEMVHSWNGKYKRPAGLNTRDYQEVINSDLLWVYEGLTQYLGYVLAARSGLISDQEFRDAAAWIAAGLDQRSGRSWRPLQDTTVAAQILTVTYGSEWENWRRRLDYYNEGFLIWLEADVWLREQTKGRASLDDFCRDFFGGKDAPPSVSSYTLDDIVASLNRIAPQDWKAFFTSRVENIQPRAPLGGIDQGGWHLMYSDKPSAYHKSLQDADEEVDERFSIGMMLSGEGKVLDVAPDKAASLSGIAPGMKVIGVNGRRWSKTRIQEAISASKNEKTDLELLVENGDFYRVHPLKYHDGAKYPALERNPKGADILGEIVRSRSESR